MVREIRNSCFRKFTMLYLSSRLSRVDYVEQVEEILAATQAKGAGLFRRPKMSASVDPCVRSIAKTLFIFGHSCCFG